MTTWLEENIPVVTRNPTSRPRYSGIASNRAPPSPPMAIVLRVGGLARQAADEWGRGADLIGLGLRGGLSLRTSPPCPLASQPKQGKTHCLPVRSFRTRSWLKNQSGAFP